MTHRRAAVTLEHDVPAVMGDGTILRADVVRPATDGPHPVLLCRTPYGKQNALVTPFLDAFDAARRGFIVVAQDVRGRGTSDGAWQPFVHEAADGHDSVLWAAALPGANGNVGMFGSSYLGFTQWAAATTGAGPLRAIAPAFTWADADDGLVRRGGVWEIGTTTYLHYYGFDAPTTAAVDTLAAGHHPDQFTRLARVVPPPLAPVDGSPSPESLSISRATPDPATTVPALNIAGWYDLFLAGTLDYYVRSRRAAAGSPARHSRLIVGPWSHVNFTGASGTYNFGHWADFQSLDGSTTAADVTFEWFDRWLRPHRDRRGTGAHPWVCGPPVRLFVVGENRWRTATAWPPAGRPARSRWLLRKTGLIEPGAAQRGSTTSTLVADPNDPVPTLGGAIHMHPTHGSGIVDHRPLTARRDVLAFTSTPLDDPLDVIGPVAAQLYITSTRARVHVVARLLDIHPDGFARNLADGITSIVDAHPHRPRMCTVDLWATANRFHAGHRVQLQVATASWPRWDRPVHTDGHPVHVSVHHDRNHPSALLLSSSPPIELRGTAAKGCCGHEPRE
jgi:uncharacterized protein